MAKGKKEGAATEYECSLTKPVEEAFSGDEVEALCAEAGKPLAECETSLVVSEDGKSHTYTVTPKDAKQIAADAPKVEPPPFEGTLIGKEAAKEAALAPTGPMYGEPGAQDLEAVEKVDHKYDPKGKAHK